MKALSCRAALRMNTMTSASGADSAQSIPTQFSPGDTIVGMRSRAIGPDLLRAAAILLVMLVHLPVEATPSVLLGVRTYGWLGVDVFFVLSGFLIGSQLFKEISRTGRLDIKSFYIRRAFRIFPTFLYCRGPIRTFPRSARRPDNATALELRHIHGELQL